MKSSLYPEIQMGFIFSEQISYFVSNFRCFISILLLFVARWIFHGIAKFVHKCFLFNWICSNSCTMVTMLQFSIVCGVIVVVIFATTSNFFFLPFVWFRLLFFPYQYHQIRSFECNTSQCLHIFRREKNSIHFVYMCRTIFG